MKNILLITNIYPMPDNNYTGTPVCHFFTREWIKTGYDVHVVHFESLFPSLYYWVGSKFQHLIEAKTGCVSYTQTPKKVQFYKIESVPVCFIPMVKYIPHTMFSEKEVQKALHTVVLYLAQEKFIPDVIVGHFTIPQLKMLYLLKQKFTQVKTALVLHNDGAPISKIYPDYKLLMDSIDVWGFRSIAFKNAFEKRYGKKEHEFLCYSGIPEKYLTPVKHDFSNGVTRFSYLGSLFKLKRVEDTIIALDKVFGEKSFSFEIVGSGAERDNLHHLVNKLNLQDKVKFHGQQSRDNAQSIIANTDCFIMVSSHEAFGLVYVEAMAKGCITIATKGQGIDGVIIDGKNGFLCESENPAALAKVIEHINSLTEEELISISRAAIETASKLTNEKVAEHYINSVLN